MKILHLTNTVLVGNKIKTQNSFQEKKKAGQNLPDNV